MDFADKNHLAQRVRETRIKLNRLRESNRKKFPEGAFEAFAAVTREYLEATGKDEMIHRCVMNAVVGLVDELQEDRLEPSGDVLYQADRLETMLLMGYDPYFEGDEPPGLSDWGT